MKRKKIKNTILKMNIIKKKDLKFYAGHNFYIKIHIVYTNIKYIFTLEMEIVIKPVCIFPGSNLVFFINIY